MNYSHKSCFIIFIKSLFIFWQQFVIFFLRKTLVLLSGKQPRLFQAISKYSIFSLCQIACQSKLEPRFHFPLLLGHFQGWYATPLVSVAAQLRWKQDITLPFDSFIIQIHGSGRQASGRRLAIFLARKSFDSNESGPVYFLPFLMLIYFVVECCPFLS